MLIYKPQSTLGAFFKQFIGTLCESKELELRDESEKIELTPISSSEKSIYIFLQGNVKASRKQVQPIIHDIIERINDC